MTAAVAAEVGQRKQVEPREQQKGQRHQRRVSDPGWRDAVTLGHGDKVGDNRQREGDGYPPVRPTNPAAGIHVALLGAWIIFQPLPAGSRKPASTLPKRSTGSWVNSTPRAFNLA